MLSMSKVTADHVSAVDSLMAERLKVVVVKVGSTMKVIAVVEMLDTCVTELNVSKRGIAHVVYCGDTLSFSVVNAQMVDEEVVIAVEVERGNRVLFWVQCGAPLI